MATSKSDLEYRHGRYLSLVSQARRAQQQGHYSEALDIAESSWPYINGHLQYEKRFGAGDARSLEGLDLVLTLAPLLFAFESLNKLEAFLASQRRIERHMSIDWSAKVTEARLILRDAHSLCDRLENSQRSRSAADSLSAATVTRWRSIVHAWEKAGFIRRSKDNTDIGYVIASDLQMQARAKCHSCGAIAKAPKSRFLDECLCPQCHQKSSFVLLAFEGIASN